MADADEKKKRKDRPSRNQQDNSGCGHTMLDGCYVMTLFDSGCSGSGNADGCLGFDGGCLDGLNGGCSLPFLPVRWLIILGLMLYGDWDYQPGRAKTTHPHQY